MVSASYFKTIGMRLRQGRLLADTDMHGTPPVTVINETMAKKFWPKGDAIGKRILVQEIVPGKTALGDEIPWEVVGVVANAVVACSSVESDARALDQNVAELTIMCWRSSFSILSPT